MLTKVYGLLWLTVIVLLGALYLTGNLGLITTVVFGFVFFGLTFMGMISVLPFWVTHQAPKH